MKTSREEQAIQAYLQIQMHKGIAGEALAQYESIVTRVCDVLLTHPHEGYAYRTAVDTVMATIAAQHQAFAIEVLRSFFPFWMNDVKAMTAPVHSVPGSADDGLQSSLALE